MPDAARADGSQSNQALEASEHPPFQQGLGNVSRSPQSEERALKSFLADSPFTEAEAERHIRTAIAYWIENRQAATVWAEASDGSYEGRPKRPILQYTSVDEFLADNPRCCYSHIHDTEGYRRGAWFRFWNSYLGVASIRKIRRTFAVTGETIIVSGDGFFIDTDGDVIEIPPTAHR